MTTVFWLFAAGVVVLLVLVAVVQLLYLESLRLRARELPALEFFKETLEERLGLKLEEGALAFSVIKHSCILLLGVSFVGLTLRAGMPSWRALLEACALSWVTLMAAGYLIPQVLYRKTSGRWLLPLMPVVRLLALLMRPLIFFFDFMQSLAELGNSDEQREENGNSAEHIEALISAGTEEGLFEEGDRKLIQSVVAFGDKTVREVMTPRPNVVAIGREQTLEELRNVVVHEQFSRIPVYEESIDQIVGFVHVRDMFELERSERLDRKVRDLMRPIRYVPETKKVSDLLREMQEDGAHLAIVVDEYGNTAGLATLEDLVEEILGEIRDEHEPRRDVIEDTDGAYIVSGSFDLDRLHDLIEFRPDEGTESTTVGGLVNEWLGRVPQPGESVERDGIRIEVVAGSERRVGQVKIRKIAKGTESEQTNAIGK